MGTVRTANEGCAINLSWAAPDDSGSPLLSFTIEISNRAGSFFPLRETQCNADNAGAASCVVPMSVFQEAPYNLSEDDLIVVRASATNALGDGVWSAPNTSGALVVTAPPALATPGLANETPDEVTVSWTPLAGTDYVYELEFDQERDGAFVQIFTGASTTYTVAKEQGRRQYSFRVRALNTCGASPNSPELTFNITLPPA